MDSEESDELVLINMEQKGVDVSVKLEAPGREDKEDGERNVMTEKNEDWQDNGMESNDQSIESKFLHWNS